MVPTLQERLAMMEGSSGFCKDRYDIREEKGYDGHCWFYL